MKNVRTIQLTFRALTVAAATGCLVLTMAGCNGCNSASTTPAPIVGSQDAANTTGADPADQNFASQPTAVLGQTASYSGQQSSENYGDGQQAPAPITQGNSQDQTYAYNQGDDSNGQYVEAEQAPPPLPEYDQPEAPDPNDIWTPGYWAYGNAGGYYWVPGAWVAAPYYGALWTPPYWGWYGSRYRFHHGYWGPHVGFYGGINYGFGYIGVGYFGGYWRGNDFYYNRNVNRIPGGWGGRAYDRPVIYNNVHYGMQPTVRISFNGGRGGINVRPRPFEVAAGRERHEGPVAAQMQAHNAAMSNRGQAFNQNHGRPAETAANHSYGNPREIRATPAGVQPGRPGGSNGNANGARPGQPAENRGAENRPGQPENRPGVNPGQQQGLRGQENRPGQPAANPGAIHNNVRPNHTMEQQERTNNPQAARPAQQPGNPGQHTNPIAHSPNMERAAPSQQRAAPQQQLRAQPQQHMQEARPQPQQQHVEQPRPQPQQRQEAPRAAAPAPHAAPAPRAAPAGGGGHEGGGGHDGHH